MPKKTKKEKLLANARRSHLAPIATRAPEAVTPLTPATSSFSFTLSSKKAPAHISPTNEPQFRQMKKDLVKTVCITIAILIGEFLLTSWLPR